MARKTVLVSDLSGTEIEDGEGASVTINFHMPAGEPSSWT